MNIIEGQNVDLISPFPFTEVRRVYGWMHCYKSIIQCDESPQTQEQFEEWLTNSISAPHIVSYGVIDKNNQLNSKHEAPLIGMILFEFSSIHNGYFHVASTRKAWGSGFMEEAGKLAFEHLFTTVPSLTRVSAFMLDRNAPAKSLARRIGMKFEGVMQDMITQSGEPVALVHFGLTRRNFECLTSEQVSGCPSSSEPVELPQVV